MCIHEVPKLEKSIKEDQGSTSGIIALQRGPVPFAPLTGSVSDYSSSHRYSSPFSYATLYTTLRCVCHSATEKASLPLSGSKNELWLGR